MTYFLLFIKNVYASNLLIQYIYTLLQLYFKIDLFIENIFFQTSTTYLNINYNNIRNKEKEEEREREEKM
jgi:hypothetical protein